MKKLFEEFKAFAMRGNVMDLAVGVIIGGAFQSIVTALTDNIITPLLNSIGASEDVAGGLVFMLNGQEINIGAFISAIIHFLIMAVVLFAIVKAINSVKNLGKKEEDVKPAIKICPYCKSEINVEATRCPCCTSEQPAQVE